MKCLINNNCSLTSQALETTGASIKKYTPSHQKYKPSIKNFMLLFVFLYIFRAVGNKMYGGQYRDHLSETLRKSAELCDCLQSFFILHSMGGGKKSCDSHVTIT